MKAFAQNHKLHKRLIKASLMKEREREREERESFLQRPAEGFSRLGEIKVSDDSSESPKNQIKTP
jgi:hypothetical protein